MKTLFQFLNEARVSQASQEAKKLNLTSDGHGSWRDSRGRLVAKTVGGKLKMLTAQERAAEEGGGKEFSYILFSLGDSVKLYSEVNILT